MMNEICVNPNDLESMIEIMDTYYDTETMFTGENELGEYVTISVFKDRIVVVTYQDNGYISEKTHWRDGTTEEVFSGRDEV